MRQIVACDTWRVTVKATGQFGRTFKRYEVVAADRTEAVGAARNEAIASGYWNPEVAGLVKQ